MIELNIYLCGYINPFDIGTMNDKIKIINLGQYQINKIFDIINDIRPNLFLLMSICYETYSYTTSVILKTGLPIFYNYLVYEYRIMAFQRNYFEFTFKNDKDLKNVIKKFEKCIYNVFFSFPVQIHFQKL